MSFSFAPQKTRKKAASPEHNEQVVVFRILALNERAHPMLKWVHAVPNGGWRHPAVAGKLKAEGVKKGVSDICVPLPFGGFHGAFIEMKAKGGRLTPEQKEFLGYMAGAGYATKVAYSADEALEFIQEYLGIRLATRLL